MFKHAPRLMPETIGDEIAPLVVIGEF